MPSVTRAAALDELEKVASDIAALHLQLAETLVAEYEAKTTTWMASDAQYLSERDRQADFNALNLSLDIIRFKGELAAAESRRSFLEFVIHWGQM